jgi:hypothetical protein
VQHPARSVFNFNPTDLIRRKELMLEKVLNDKKIANEFENWLPALKGHTYGYVALHLAMAGYRKRAFDYFIKAARIAPEVCLSKRTLAIMKHLLKQKAKLPV